MSTNGMSGLSSPFLKIFGLILLLFLGLLFFAVIRIAVRVWIIFIIVVRIVTAKYDFIYCYLLLFELLFLMVKFDSICNSHHSLFEALKLHLVWRARSTASLRLADLRLKLADSTFLIDRHSRGHKAVFAITSHYGYIGHFHCLT